VSAQLVQMPTVSLALKVVFMHTVGSASWSPQYFVGE
jgi:hypothetical protein